MEEGMKGEEAGLEESENIEEGEAKNSEFN
jgi:hypothetical protein